MLNVVEAQHLSAEHILLYPALLVPHILYFMTNYFLKINIIVLQLMHSIDFT